MSESAAMTPQIGAEVVTVALRRAGNAKTIGRLTDKSPRTVERWLRGEAEPPASALVLLLARSREVARTILEAAGLTDELMNAEEARLRAELTALLVRRGDAKTAAPAGATCGWDGVERRAARVAEAALNLSRNLR